MPESTYVLITPVKNEEALIGTTIDSVARQTRLPSEWVIVSDGSTDQTENIVLRAAAANPWIRLVALPSGVQRNFAAVVRAAETGIRSLRFRDYAFLGLLDSDLRFQPDYFERVIAEFHASPRLGLAGGVVHDIGARRRLPDNRQDVPGAVQFFRRECFEALGGLIAVPEGGWDGLTCAQARMAGFETRLLIDLQVDHLKPRNMAEGGWLRRKWQMGVRDYAVGADPVFEFAKCLRRMTQSPAVLGAAAWWIGYCCAAAQRRPRRIPAQLLAFMRTEQRKRLSAVLFPAQSPE